MTPTEAVENLLKTTRHSKSWLADRMGVGQNAISNMLSRGNLTMATLGKICDEMEYEITIQPKRRAGARPSGQIVIDQFPERKKRGKQTGSILPAVQEETP